MKKFVALVAVAALVAFAAPAFAANPFMDVPMNHWAYDAVSQLAARGIVTGYPDGAFKGEWKATRYEMASVVARALAYVDMNKASKEDLELLKRLVVEFKDELDALGVKVEDIDSRLSLIEERLGGWQFGGYFRTKAVFGDDDDNWAVDRFRLNMKKYLDDKVTMNIRLQGGGGQSLAVELAYLTIKDLLLEGSSLNVGRFWMDWEGGLYTGGPWWFNMNDAYITDIRLNHAFHYNVPIGGMGDFSLYVAHDENRNDLSWESDTARFMGPVNSYAWPDIVYRDGFDVKAYTDSVSDRYVYGASLSFNFNEMFSMGLNYLKFDYEDNVELLVDVTTFRRWLQWNHAFTNYVYSYAPTETESLGTLAADTATMWVDLAVNFTPGITLKGAYYMQNNDEAWQVTGYSVDVDNPTPGIGHVIPDIDVTGGLYADDPSAWKAILEIDKSVLGFTDLWIEYAQLDAGFVFPNGADPYGWFSYTGAYTNSFGQVAADTDILNVIAKQEWNAKWWTYIRYLNVDAGSYVDYDNWTAAVQYWYTPNMAFELGYDKLGGDLDGDSIWLRTAVFF